MSEKFEAFLKSNGVKHIHCFPYHPSSNGAMERFVQRSKKAMRAQKPVSVAITCNSIPVNLQNNTTQYVPTTNVAPCTVFLKREL